MWRDEIEQIVRGAGFVPEYDPRYDMVVCMAPGQDYSLLILQRSGQWYLSNRCGRFFQLSDASMLADLCAVLFQERPGCAIGDVHDASWSELPEHIKVRFKLEEVEQQERVEELLQPHLQGGLLYREYLAKKFGFRGYSAGEEAVGMGLAEAKALVEKDRGHPISFSPEGVMLNDDLFYIPPARSGCVMGCVGYLVGRRSGRVMFLQSGILPHVRIWALYRGFFDCKGLGDTLLIRAVHNLEKTRELLTTVLRSNIAARELGQKLHNPPCVFRRVYVGSYIREFMEAEEKGYFDFEVNPSDAYGAALEGGAARFAGASGVIEGSGPGIARPKALKPIEIVQRDLEFGPFSTEWYRRSVDSHLRRCIFQYFQEQILPRLHEVFTHVEGVITSHYDAPEFASRSQFQYRYFFHFAFHWPEGMEIAHGELIYDPGSRTCAESKVKPLTVSAKKLLDLRAAMFEIIQ
jgi:hypothetical protein